MSFLSPTTDLPLQQTSSNKKTPVTNEYKRKRSSLTEIPLNIISYRNVPNNLQDDDTTMNINDNNLQDDDTTMNLININDERLAQKKRTLNFRQQNRQDEIRLIELDTEQERALESLRSIDSNFLPKTKPTNWSSGKALEKLAKVVGDWDNRSSNPVLASMTIKNYAIQVNIPESTLYSYINSQKSKRRKLGSRKNTVFTDTEKAEILQHVRNAEADQIFLTAKEVKAWIITQRPDVSMDQAGRTWDVLQRENKHQLNPQRQQYTKERQKMQTVAKKNKKKHEAMLRKAVKKELREWKARKTMKKTTTMIGKHEDIVPSAPSYLLNEAQNQKLSTEEIFYRKNQLAIQQQAEDCLDLMEGHGFSTMAELRKYELRRQELDEEVEEQCQYYRDKTKKELESKEEPKQEESLWTLYELEQLIYFHEEFSQFGKETSEEVADALGKRDKESVMNKVAAIKNTKHPLCNEYFTTLDGINVVDWHERRSDFDKSKASSVWKQQELSILALGIENNWSDFEIALFIDHTNLFAQTCSQYTEQSKNEIERAAKRVANKIYALDQSLSKTSSPISQTISSSSSSSSPLIVGNKKKQQRQRVLLNFQRLQKSERLKYERAEKKWKEIKINKAVIIQKKERRRQRLKKVQDQQDRKKLDESIYQVAVMMRGKTSIIEAVTKWYRTLKNGNIEILKLLIQKNHINYCNVRHPTRLYSSGILELYDGKLLFPQKIAGEDMYTYMVSSNFEHCLARANKLFRNVIEFNGGDFFPSD